MKEIINLVGRDIKCFIDFVASIGSTLETTNDISALTIFRSIYAMLKFILVPPAVILLNMAMTMLFTIITRTLRRIFDCCNLRRRPQVSDEVDSGTTGILRELPVEIISILDSIRLGDEAEMVDVPLNSPVHEPENSSRYNVFLAQSYV
jgi:hypothetical protein